MPYRALLTSLVPAEPELGPEAVGPLPAPAPVAAGAPAEKKNTPQGALREPRRQALRHYGPACGGPLFRS